MSEIRIKKGLVRKMKEQNLYMVPQLRNHKNVYRFMCNQKNYS